MEANDLVQMESCLCHGYSQGTEGHRSPWKTGYMHMSEAVKLSTKIVFKVFQRPSVASRERGDGLESRRMPEHEMMLMSDKTKAVAMSHRNGGFRFLLNSVFAHDC